MTLVKVILENLIKFYKCHEKISSKTAHSIMEIDWTLSLSLILYFSPIKSEIPQNKWRCNNYKRIQPYQESSFEVCFIRRQSIFFNIYTSGIILCLREMCCFYHQKKLIRIWHQFPNNLKYFFLLDFLFSHFKRSEICTNL